MKRLYAYIRVSDPKQGLGVSLAEQQSVIEGYAARIGGEIIEWFKETRTAAKAGRPVFARMTKLLRARKADGVIVHKLDRSTRNYRDWAEIDELLESGIDIFVASENLDLRSRGGRLAADVEIAVAVDFIRNLRAETLKGIEGRLKQGILPCGVGIGYLNSGAGKPKAIDPVRGPLVRRVFELYATGRYTLRDLTREAETLGLRSRNGNPLRLQQFQALLRNPFYAGAIHSKRFGVFQGAHTPIVSRSLFDRVQAVLDGKRVRRTKRFWFQFRRLLHCQTCGRCLIGSERKGYVYYRCSNIPCPTTSVREDAVERAMKEALRGISFRPEEVSYLQQQLAANSDAEERIKAARRVALNQTLAALNARAARLTDLLLDGKVDSEAHDERRAALIAERQKIEQELGSLDAEYSLGAVARQIVELAKSPETLYESADAEGRRQFLEIVLSNATVSGKCVEFTWLEPFATISKRLSRQLGAPLYDTPRTSVRNRTFSAEALLQACDACTSEMISALREFMEDKPPS
jgi:DNA invertase Pin-like site-specific DNA recombinase